MILRDFVTGIAHLAERHRWFVSNMRFERDPDAALIEMDKEDKERSVEIEMIVRIDAKTMAAVVIIDGSVSGVLGRSVSDEDVLDAFRRFAEADHYRVFEIIKPLTAGTPDSDVKITINPKPDLPPCQPYRPTPGWPGPFGTGTGGPIGPTWGGGTGASQWGDSQVPLTQSNAAHLDNYVPSMERTEE